MDSIVRFNSSRRIRITELANLPDRERGYCPGEDDFLCGAGFGTDNRYECTPAKYLAASIMRSAYALTIPFMTCLLLIVTVTPLGMSVAPVQAVGWRPPVYP